MRLLHIENCILIDSLLEYELLKMVLTAFSAHLVVALALLRRLVHPG